MALLKLLKVDLLLSAQEMLLAKKPPFFSCSRPSELSLREILIGLIMFAVIKHLNGTPHNMRRES